MAYNENTQNLLEIASETAEAITTFIQPILEGDRLINDSKIDDAIVEQWSNLQETTEKLIDLTNTEMLIEDLEEEDSNEATE